MSPSPVKFLTRRCLELLSVCVLSSPVVAQNDDDQAPRRFRTRGSQGRVLADLDTQNKPRRATNSPTSSRDAKGKKAVKSSRPSRVAGSTADTQHRTTKQRRTTAKPQDSKTAKTTRKRKRDTGWRLPGQKRRQANAPVVDLAKSAGPNDEGGPRPRRPRAGNARIAPLLLAQAVGGGNQPDARDPAEAPQADEADADEADADEADADETEADETDADETEADAADDAGDPVADQADQDDAPEDGDIEAIETIEPTEGLGGQMVSITEGEIPLREFLRFLADHTQRIVITDSTDKGFLDRPIIILSEIQDANYDIVKAILETNKVRVFHEELTNGMEIIKCEPMVAAGQPRDPKAGPVLRVGEGGQTKDSVTGEVANVGDDQFATIVFTLTHVPPADAIEALKALVGGQAAGSKGARGSSTFSMVEIKNTQTLIITAKFGLLTYLKTLLQLIDVPFEDPERIIQILQIEWADAQELSSVIEQFLQGRGRGSRFGRGGQRAVTGAAGARSTGSQSRGGGSNRNNEFQTSIIPDTRTNKLIVETFLEADLRDIQMLVNELDVRFEQRRLRTHIYQVRYLKADEVASDLTQLVQGSGGGGGLGGRSGGRSSRLRGGVPRVSSRGRAGGAGGAGAGQNTGAPQNVEFPVLIIPHIPTNSLLIQAEIEDYDEILNILREIDTKRRQVFLEAAVVQVQSTSDLAFAIDLIAGNPDGQATRILGSSSFTGLSGIDLETFDRIIGDSTSPGVFSGTGGFLAIMREGDFPFLMRFLKTNADTEVLATPFIVADDNEDNSIEILETRYVQNTAVQNNQTTLSSQQGEPAGITLSLTPTISGSQKAVFLTLDLSVSSFTGAGSETVLPPKSENTLTSSVTIPDGKIFVVGGLTREDNSKAISKIPILGDIPILGKLFRDESTSRSQNNLYVFLQAHVLADEEFRDAVELTQQAEDQMTDFSQEVNPIRFRRPAVSENKTRAEEDGENRRFFELNPSREGARYNPYDDVKNRARRQEPRENNERRENLRRERDRTPTQVPSSSYEDVPDRPSRDGELDSRRRTGSLEYQDTRSDSPPDSQEKGSKDGSGWFDLK